MPATSIAVAGAGTMGTGIAHLAARSGCRVALIDTDAAIVQRAIDAIADRLAGSVEKGKLSPANRDAILGRIRVASATDDFSACDLIIEAIIEDREAKSALFARLEKSCGEQTTLASNTSSLSITTLSEDLARPERLVGMHFFNPAPVMPLVEIIAGERSDPARVNFAFDTAVAWGKTAVRCKDTPGFIVNRVARPFYLEALRMLGEGAAPVDAIDSAMKAGGFRMGPFETMDLVGIDVNYAVSQSVYEQSGRPADLKPHGIQASLVREKKFGRKTGRGFYDYTGDAPKPADLASGTVAPSTEQRAIAEKLCKSAGVSASATDAVIFARILSALIREAWGARDRGVATASDIDTAMMKGVNYPKGLIAWGNVIGRERVVEAFETLADRPF